MLSRHSEVKCAAQCQKAWFLLQAKGFLTGRLLWVFPKPIATIDLCEVMSDFISYYLKMFLLLLSIISVLSTSLNRRGWRVLTYKQPCETVCDP